VAAELDGEVVVGVVEVPTQRRRFTAARGAGARVNDQPIRPTSVGDLAHALVATGFGYEEQRRAEQAAALAHVVPRVRDVRRFGAAAADLCLLASGGVDAYFERGLEAWDLAAGRLIATEAGARVEVQPDAGRGDLVVGAGPALFADFVGLLRAVDA